MSEITISKPMQVGLALATLGALAAVTALELPELQRYMKIRSM
jgi:hypothetical protein